MIRISTIEGNNFIGEARVLDTVYGKIVKSLIDEGARLGVSFEVWAHFQNGSD